MVDELIVRDESGSRRFGVADGPLVAGGSVRCQIVLPDAGPRDEPMLIGVSAGRVFAQPGAGGESVRLNGAPLAASQWLEDGDQLQVGTSMLHFRQSGVTGTLTLAAGGREDDTLPPLVAEPPPAQASIDAVPYVSPDQAPARRRARAPWGRVLVASTVAVVALLVWYTFTGVSVRVLVEPAPDSLDVDGGMIPIRFGDRHLLRPGQYSLEAEKAGYRDLREVLEVGEESSQTIRFQMQKLPGQVSFATKPAVAAEVFVDGRSIGQTPIAAAEIEAGKHGVELRAPRYLAHTSELDVVGMGQAQTVEVELTPAWAPVRITSNPSGATVMLGAEDQGETPLTLELLQGEHTLALRQAGFDDWQGTIQVEANQPLELPTVELVPSKAKLTLETKPQGATVSVDGAFVGRTPTEMVLTPDEDHDLVIAKAGFKTHRESVSLEPGETRARSVDLEVIAGSIAFRVEPADAELVIDGRSRGRARQTLWLAAVPHKVEIRKRGYHTYRTTVTPRPGFEQALSVSLSPATGVVPGTQRGVVTNSQGQVLRLIPAAEFVMGSSRREQGRRSNETRRRIILTRPYYLGVEEISNAEYRRFDSAHRSGTAGSTSLDLEDQPVVNVSWDQAARYCNWLSKQEDLPPAYVDRGGKMVMVSPLSKGYRLPTEAEWVRAARYSAGGSGVKYAWGSSWPPKEGSGNFADVSSKTLIASSLSGYNDGFLASAPGGSFGANQLGLYDMGGNVAEWVNDVYSIYPGGSAPIADPMGPVEGKHHTIRGASWRDSSMSRLRISYRAYGREGRSDVGFRIARYAD